MLIILIRHAHAEEAATFSGDDLDRPLTERGRKLFRRAIACWVDQLEPPAAVYSSEAVRARETAELVAESFGVREVLVDAALNPGATWAKYRKVLKTCGQEEPVVLVGHEPDLSGAIYELTGGQVRMKKGAVALVDWPGKGRGTLLALAAPRLLGGR